ncbi:TetR/AcrR family transcriptional regulator [Cohnella sp. WQ 127256]|uniref:TetR/AcrR family transcriptional regulator n=1 Tax=Cohnella sp. WQ 127256 TaxID=2938790 RepID=UPI0021199A70|nr:TetR-like C-terminal domain-containing protein [Cohnella sp. WQ 127256]
MNENDLRVINTKKALHQALLTLLKTKSLESITVSTLCREAVVSRGAFYMHFKDIGALFDEHIHNLLKDLEDSYYEPYRHVEHLVPSHLDPSTIRIFHHVKKYQSFYEIVFDKKSTLSYYYSLFAKIKSLMQEYSSGYTIDERNISLLVAYQANAIMGMLIEWNEVGFAHSPEYMNEQLSYLLRMQE